jgi:hypothetical protein
MRRRDFIAGIGAVVSLPHAARAAIADACHRVSEWRLSVDLGAFCGGIPERAERGWLR